MVSPDHVHHASTEPLRTHSGSFVGGVVCVSTWYSVGSNDLTKDQVVGIVPTHIRIDTVTGNRLNDKPTNSTFRGD